MADKQSVESLLVTDFFQEILSIKVRIARIIWRNQLTDVSP